MMYTLSVCVKDDAHQEGKVQEGKVQEGKVQEGKIQEREALRMVSNKDEMRHKYVFYQGNIRINDAWYG